MLGLVFCLCQVQAQTLIRQSLGSVGGSSTAEGITVQSTVGQASATSTAHGKDGGIRQGFIQSPSKFIVSAKPIPSVLIYPNPSSGLFTIDMEFEPGDFYVVYSSLGTKVAEQQITSSCTFQMCDISNYSTGVYTVSIFRKNKIIQTNKIIISL
ncbi:MAG: T9SS type A sorting domain-containing protein [Bacteroidia bacterium]